VNTLINVNVIFRTGPRAAHVVSTGDLVPADTILVTPAMEHRGSWMLSNFWTTKCFQNWKLVSTLVDALTGVSKLFCQRAHELLHNSSWAGCLIRTVIFSGYVTFHQIDKFF